MYKKLIAGLMIAGAGVFGQTPMPLPEGQQIEIVAETLDSWAVESVQVLGFIDNDERAIIRIRVGKTVDGQFIPSGRRTSMVIRNEPDVEKVDAEGNPVLDAEGNPEMVAGVKWWDQFKAGILISNGKTITEADLRLLCRTIVEAKWASDQQ